MKILQFASIFPLDISPYENPYVANYIEYYLQKYPEDSIQVLKPRTYTPGFLIDFMGNKTKRKQELHIAKHKKLKYKGLEVMILPYFSVGTVSVLHTLFSYIGFYMKIKAIKRAITGADVIHAHYLFPDGLFAFLASKKFNVPYTLTIRQEKRFLTNKISRHFTRKIIDNAVAASSQSFHMKEALTKRNISNIQLIPTGIHPGFFKKGQFSNEKPKQNNKLKLVSVCNLLPIKNIETVIDALANLEEKYQVQYEIYGTGPQEAKLKTMVSEAGLEQIVHFKGKIDNKELINLLPRYNIFVQPSFKETFGLSYFEALACGLPVMLTENTGAYPLIKDYDVSFVVDPYSVTSVKDCLQDILENPELTKEKSQNTMKAAKIASWDNYIDFFHTSYKNDVKR